MTIKEQQYYNLINLLNKQQNPAELLLDLMKITDAELAFSSFDNTSKMTKDHIYDVYLNRATLQSQLNLNKDEIVIGFDKLLDKLKEANTDFVNVNTITSDFGTFIIFTDYEYELYIGILKSNRKLSELREIAKKYKDFDLTIINALN